MHDRRPVKADVQAWYDAQVEETWEEACRPSFKETHDHAKCLRSTEDVRNYFRRYRAIHKAHRQARRQSDGSAAATTAAPPPVPASLRLARKSAPSGLVPMQSDDAANGRWSSGDTEEALKLQAAAQQKQAAPAAAHHRRASTPATPLAPCARGPAALTAMAAAPAPLPSLHQQHVGPGLPLAAADKLPMLLPLRPTGTAAAARPSPSLLMPPPLQLPHSPVPVRRPASASSPGSHLAAAAAAAPGGMAADAAAGGNSLLAMLLAMQGPSSPSLEGLLAAEACTGSCMASAALAALRQLRLSTGGGGLGAAAPGAAAAVAATPTSLASLFPGTTITTESPAKVSAAGSAAAVPAAVAAGHSVSSAAGAGACTLPAAAAEATASACLTDASPPACWFGASLSPGITFRANARSCSGSMDDSTAFTAAQAASHSSDTGQVPQPQERAAYMQRAENTAPLIGSAQLLQCPVLCQAEPLLLPASPALHGFAQVDQPAAALQAAEQLRPGARAAITQQQLWAEGCHKRTGGGRLVLPQASAGSAALASGLGAATAAPALPTRRYLGEPLAAPALADAAPGAASTNLAALAQPAASRLGQQLPNTASSGLVIPTGNRSAGGALAGEARVPRFAEAIMAPIPAAVLSASPGKRPRHSKQGYIQLPLSPPLTGGCVAVAATRAAAAAPDNTSAGAAIDAPTPRLPAQHPPPALVLLPESELQQLPSASLSDMAVSPRALPETPLLPSLDSPQVLSPLHPPYQSSPLAQPLPPFGAPAPALLPALPAFDSVELEGLLAMLDPPFMAAPPLPPPAPQPPAPDADPMRVGAAATAAALQPLGTVQEIQGQQQDDTLLALAAGMGVADASSALDKSCIGSYTQDLQPGQQLTGLPCSGAASGDSTRATTGANTLLAGMAVAADGGCTACTAAPLELAFMPVGSLQVDMDEVMSENV